MGIQTESREYNSVFLYECVPARQSDISQLRNYIDREERERRENDKRKLKVSQMMEKSTKNEKRPGQLKISRSERGTRLLPMGSSH
jgi:hypothetical protein